MIELNKEVIVKERKDNGIERKIESRRRAKSQGSKHLGQATLRRVKEISSSSNTKPQR
jgi:hypothetical protein